MKYSVILKNLRSKLLITQTELSEMLGVSYASVNRWENEKSKPTMKAKRKIRDLCQKEKVNLEE